MEQMMGFVLFGIPMPHRLLHKLLNLPKKIQVKVNSGLVVYAALYKSVSLMGTHVPVRLFLSLQGV